MRDWKLGPWSLERAIFVVGIAAVGTIVACIGDAAGWHGAGSAYHVTPFGECLTKGPIIFILIAVFFDWVTRNDNVDEK